MEDADLKKIHPMTKKSIKTFIEKNGLDKAYIDKIENLKTCLLYTSPSPRD